MDEAGLAARAAAANGMAEAAEVGAAETTGGNAGAEAAVAAAGGAAEGGPGAAEVEAESVTDGAPGGKKPKPANWESMTMGRAAAVGGDLWTTAAARKKLGTAAAKN